LPASHMTHAPAGAVCSKPLGHGASHHGGGEAGGNEGGGGEGGGDVGGGGEGPDTGTVSSVVGPSPTMVTPVAAESAEGVRLSIALEASAAAVILVVVKATVTITLPGRAYIVTSHGATPI
jgi:hypothetical protein